MTHRFSDASAFPTGEESETAVIVKLPSTPKRNFFSSPPNPSTPHLQSPTAAKSGSTRIFPVRGDAKHTSQPSDKSPPPRPYHSSKAAALTTSAALSRDELLEGNVTSSANLGDTASVHVAGTSIGDNSAAQSSYVPLHSPVPDAATTVLLASHTMAQSYTMDAGAVIEESSRMMVIDSPDLYQVPPCDRRSVTVARHPLDTTTHAVLLPIASGPRRAPLFGSDFDSPGRGADPVDNWKENEEIELATMANGHSTVDGGTPVGSYSVSANLLLVEPGPNAGGPATAAHEFLSNAHVEDGPSAANLTEPCVRTPYPVTSVTSAEDWSSAPRMGFAAPSDPAAAGAEARSLLQRETEERKREEKWYRLCRGVSLLASATPESVVLLRAAARKNGIPHHLRGVMWLTLTGMALKVDENEYFCAKLLRRNGYVTGPHADAIAADVQRTFPGHPYFSDRDVGIYKLTTVLHALCWRNPLLSYCQSFNFLAAFLLLVLDDEERVFWLLNYIFEELLPNDFYGETLLGANVEQLVLERLVQQRLPRVAAKFRAAGLQVHTLVANWIMSLFVNIFPPSTSLRMWDYILCRTPNPGERTPAHLEITLAVLKYLEDKGCLVGEDPGELLIALREQAACLYDAAEVIRIAHTLVVTPGELHQLRREVKPGVVHAMKTREAARVVERERRVAQEAQHARSTTLKSTPPLP